jgi:hypothetical protein
MTPRIGLFANTSLNQFKFSSCSKAYFKKTLLTKEMEYFIFILYSVKVFFVELFFFSLVSDVTSFGKCLLNMPVLIDSALNVTTFEYPGQVWSADSQCKMIYGNNASFCRVNKLFKL